MPLTLANVINRNVLLGDGVGTTGAPGSYFGFGQSGTSPASTGPRIQASSGNPNGIVSAPIGSMWIDSAGGTTYTNTDGGTTWAALGGGTNAVRDWFPLIQQSPQNAKSDYFLGTTINPIWTQWNPGGNTTFAASATTRLGITQTPMPAPTLGGLIQTAPASARYALTAVVFPNAQAITSGIVSMAVIAGGDLIGSPTTAPVVLAEQYQDGTPNSLVSLTSATNYNTGFTSHRSAGNVGWYPYVLRLFVDTVAQTYTFVMGAKGNDMRSLQTVAFAATALTVAPTTIGIAIDNDQSGKNMTGYFAMFRVDATADPYLPCGGFA